MIVTLLTALYMFAEGFGGWWTGSLALFADAGHMLADVAALTLALVAVWFGARAATPGKTFWLLPFGDSGRLHQRRGAGTDCALHFL
jgi:Co/Zn/Cd efflux system component